MFVGTLATVEITTGDPTFGNGEKVVLKRLVLTNTDGRQWEKTEWFTVYDKPKWIPTEPHTIYHHHHGNPAPYRIEHGITICMEESSIGALLKATNDQLKKFEQDADTIRWPDLGASFSKERLAWWKVFGHAIRTEQEENEWEAILIQNEIDDIEEEQGIFGMTTVRTEDQSRQEFSRRKRLTVLRGELGEIPLSSEKPTDNGEAPEKEPVFAGRTPNGNRAPIPACFKTKEYLMAQEGCDERTAEVFGKFFTAQGQEHSEEFLYLWDISQKMKVLGDSYTKAKAIIDNPDDPNHVTNLNYYLEREARLGQEISLLDAKEKAGPPGTMPEETTLPAPGMTELPTPTEPTEASVDISKPADLRPQRKPKTTAATQACTQQALAKREAVCAAMDTLITVMPEWSDGIRHKKLDVASSILERINSLELSDESKQCLLGMDEKKIANILSEQFKFIGGHPGNFQDLKRTLTLRFPIGIKKQ